MMGFQKALPADMEGATTKERVKALRKIAKQQGKKLLKARHGRYALDNLQSDSLDVIEHVLAGGRFNYYTACGIPLFQEKEGPGSDVCGSEHTTET